MFRCRAIVPVALALCVGLAACTGSNTADPNAPDQAAQSINTRIGGVWRLTNYIPEHDLSPALLLSMQSDKIMVRFDVVASGSSGVVSSVSSSFDFERRFRIADVKGDVFRLYIEDAEGVEYLSICHFDELGNLEFETETEPWRGRGVLTREGPAISAQP